MNKQPVLRSHLRPLWTPHPSGYHRKPEILLYLPPHCVLYVGTQVQWYLFLGIRCSATLSTPCPLRLQPTSHWVQHHSPYLEPTGLLENRTHTSAPLCYLCLSPGCLSWFHRSTSSGILKSGSLPRFMTATTNTLKGLKLNMEGSVPLLWLWLLSFKKGRARAHHLHNIPQISEGAAYSQ